MLKIGIELPDERIYNVDLSNPDLGNPGVGGSEYLFILLAKHLCEKFQVIVYHYSDNILPKEVNHIIVKNPCDMINKAVLDKVDVLIHQVGKTVGWYSHLNTTTLKAIAWAHIYLEYYELVCLRSSVNSKRVVFVGKEEYDSYIDDDIIKKSTFIYNMIPTQITVRERELKKPIVTYVGSLVPQKGFHKLAEIWPEILKLVPNAELNVIGTGKVYDRDAQLGKYGISQKDYEDSFMKYLTEDDGSINPSVHFLGIVGSEKIDIFSSTAVGVVNPSALTETFCMSAVEMEYACVPIVSRAKWGLLDTIKSGKTGFLFKTKKGFIKSLSKLLIDNELNFQMGKEAQNFVLSSFSTSKIIPEWVELISLVANNVPPEYIKPTSNWLNDYKQIKLIFRFIRYNLRIKSFPSFYDIKQFLKKLMRRT